MELDELKSHWKEISLREQEQSIDRTEIHQMITMQSKSLISSATRRLRTKVRSGTIVGILTLLLGLVTLFVKDDQTSMLDAYIPHATRYYMMTFMSLFILFIAWYNRKQYLKLLVLEQSTTNLREALDSTIQRLNSVMKASVLSDTIGAPIIVLWITYIQLYWGAPFIIDTRVLALVGITIASIPVIYFVARQGQRSKYGSHLHELKQCLSELNTSSFKIESHEPQA